MTAQEDAKRLEEIKAKLQNLADEKNRANQDMMAVGILSWDVPFLISQAERLAKVEDSLRVAEEALLGATDWFCSCGSSPEMSAKMDQIQEALKKIRGEQ